MFEKLTMAALGVLAVTWCTGFDVVEAKDAFVSAIEDTGTRLAGGEDDWYS